MIIQKAVCKNTQSAALHSEFPSVVDIYDAASEKDEEGKPVLVQYPDPHHGTIEMAGSELAGHLLLWDRHVIPVM